MSRFAIIFPWKEPKSWNKAMADISNKYNTGYLSKNKFSVADCLKSISVNCGDFRYISKL